MPIVESSPTKRTGPRWHAQPNPTTALQACIELIFKPNQFFRMLRVDGSNVTARLFLLLTCLLIALIWFYAVWGRSLSDGSTAWAMIQGLLACDFTIILTYIEAIGVVYFSRRRGWRISFKLAERIACYSSIGWVPAALIMLWVLAHLNNGDIDRWMSSLLPAWEYWQSLALMVLCFAVAMMWFEVLVWLGVRQAKYANS